MTELTLPGTSPFDAIRREHDGHEYWSGRDLMPLLGYEKWERFEESVERARASAANAGHDADREASRLREPSGRTNRQSLDNLDLYRGECRCYDIQLRAVEADLTVARRAQKAGRDKTSVIADLTARRDALRQAVAR